MEFFAKEHPNKLKTNGIIWEGGREKLKAKRPHIGLGVKGICYVELKLVREPKYGLTFFRSSKLLRIQLGGSFWALSTLKNEQEEILN